MPFRTNDCQQLSLNDKRMNLTEREKKALDKSWAKIFADEIFPAIDGKPRCKNHCNLWRVQCCIPGCKIYEVVETMYIIVEVEFLIC